MELRWTYDRETAQQVKYFLKEQGASKGLLVKVKFQGGKIQVNGIVQNAIYPLQTGDVVRMTIPDEAEHETLLTDDEPAEVVFEDGHFLVVNRPAGIAPTPAQYRPSGTMANRVKGYYKRQNYVSQVIHAVTRLDRDTSGLMSFAKHGFAHALTDQELREKKVTKVYYVLVGGAIEQLNEHQLIERPIRRDLSFLLKRRVTETGQFASTEYWLAKRGAQTAAVRVQLHTGRTHQTRVHFEAAGCSLLGDEMYHGKMDQGIKRQALHCMELIFTHPFTEETVHLISPLAGDTKSVGDTL